MLCITNITTPNIKPPLAKEFINHHFLGVYNERSDTDFVFIRNMSRNHPPYLILRTESIDGFYLFLDRNMMDPVWMINWKSTEEEDVG